MTPLEVALFQGTVILAPVVGFFSRPLLAKRPVLASPFLLVPLVSVLSLWAYFEAVRGYFHFLVLPVVFAVSLLAMRRLKFSAADSALLALMVVFASDQLWQLPVYAVDWSQSSLAFRAGLSTAPFDLMALPLFFVLLGGLKIDLAAFFALYAALFATVDEILAAFAGAVQVQPYPVGWQPYFLYFFWAAAFLLIARSTALRSKALPRPCESAESGRLSSS